MFDNEFGKGFSIVAILLGLVLVLTAIVRTSNGPAHKLDETAGYDMIRPSEYTGSFDLSGREVSRTVIGGQKIELNRSPKAQVGKPLPKAPHAKMINNMAKNAAAAKALAAQKKRKATLTLNSVNTRGDASPQFFLNSIDTDRATTNPSPNLGRLADAEAAAQTPAVVTPVEVQPALSAGQWRALLQNQPTSANAAEFIKAHAKSEIDNAAFYQIALELFSDPADDRHKIGLLILNQDSSLSGFEPIAKAYSKANENQRGELWKILLSYGQVNKLPGLAAAFNSSDKSVVILAGQVLNSALSNFKIKASTVTTAGTTGTVTAASAQIFKTFIPILTKLVKSPDESIAQMAKSLLAGIQSLLTP